MKSSSVCEGVSAARVLLDFDGTVTHTDTVDLLLERFALPEWREIEREWESGAIGSRECLERQSALLRVTPSDLDSAVDEVPVDPAFQTLVRRCHAHALDLLIVSDGYDRVIRRVLDRVGVQVPSVANVLLPKGHNEWTLLSPASVADCRVRAAHCKCHRVGVAGPVLLIGDGRSDFCVAHEVSFVIAKGRLARYCTEQRIPHAAIDNLSEALDALENWIPETGEIS